MDGDLLDGRPAVLGFPRAARPAYAFIMIKRAFPKYRCLLAVGVLLVPSLAPAQATRPSGTPAERAQRLVDSGLGYLKAQQMADGSFAKTRGSLAITALALKGFSQNPATRDADFVRTGYEFLLKNQLESGGIYKDTLASYNTAISISALAKAGRPEYRPAIDKAVAYLKTLQWSDTMDGLPKGEKLSPNDPRSGGWGYGSKGRPDGSNTAFAIDALKEAGLSESDPAFQRAAQFMSNMQNLGTNKAPWATNDGGFIYSPAFGGESFAGEYEEKNAAGKTIKRFNSYGTMTYAGIKSLVYAGISRDDPRVIAAYRWICDSFTLTTNPGMEKAGAEHATDGLYYYYHVLARALSAYGQPVLPTKSGSLDWRLALLSRLEEAQQPNGSWVGTKAYMETNPTLTTAYTVLAVQEILADLKRSPAEQDGGSR